MNQSHPPLPNSHSLDRRVYTVSELTLEIKRLLEDKFAFIWISGEISNLTIAASGHLYFTIKDRQSQISAVIFKGQARQMRLKLAEGLSVIGFGRLSVYEPRGTYQIIIEYLEKRGIGELLADLEALKARLAEEGLFDATHKKTLPFLPRTVCVITSPTGAVIQDIIITATRRFPGIEIEILPVSVQGPQAATEIVDAIDLLNQRERAEVAILARGGGAIEDFQAFNSEPVARAIFASKIPIVSAVGHETDYTIADLVADLRAPTPTAAAELVVPLKDELMLSCLTLHQRLCQVFHRILEDRRRHLDGWSQRMVHPRKKIENWAMRVDELTERLIRVSKDGLQQRTHQLAWWTERLKANRTEEKLLKLKEKIEHLKYNLLINMNIIIDADRQTLRAHQAALQALNPRAILQRGYSITRTLPNHVIIRDSAGVKDCQILEITLAKGSLQVKTLKKT